MKILSHISARTQLTFLLVGIIMLTALSFVPNSREGISSSETRFTEISSHGLGITPASCESLGPSAYHDQLQPSSDGLGFISYTGGSSAGAYAPYAGEYVCVINNTGLTYFVPAHTAAELNAFKAASRYIGQLSAN